MFKNVQLKVLEEKKCTIPYDSNEFIALKCKLFQIRPTIPSFGKLLHIISEMFSASLNQETYSRRSRMCVPWTWLVIDESRSY